MAKKVFHYVPHMCGPQECDCVPICHSWGFDTKGTSAKADVTCKNCLRIIYARHKPAPDRNLTKGF